MIQRHRFNRRQTANAFRRTARAAGSLVTRARARAFAPYGAIAAGASMMNRSRSRVTKKSKLHQSAKASVGGHGGTYSSFYYRKSKVPRGFRSTIKALSKNYYVWNGSARLTGTPGAQAPAVLQSLFHYTDLNAISQKVNSNQTNKVLFQSVSSEALLTNQDTGNVNVVLYDIIARRDLSTQTNLATPLAAWQNSYSDEGGSNANYSVIGATPFSSDLFTQFFKVVKVTHITLGQGQSHTHRIKYTPNRLVDGELINYNTNGLKQLTCFTMAVAYGMPYNDSTTKSQVSTGATAIDFVVRKQYQYTWQQDLDTTFSVSNNLVTSFTVGEDIMNEATGTATVDAAA